MNKDQFIILIMCLYIPTFLWGLWGWSKFNFWLIKVTQTLLGANNEINATRVALAREKEKAAMLENLFQEVYRECYPADPNAECWERYENWKLGRGAILYSEVKS